MIEKGSRKTAPPDTARVKVHKYNLQMESHTHEQKQTHRHTQVLGLVQIKRAEHMQNHNKIIKLFISLSNQIICYKQLLGYWRINSGLHDIL